MKHIIKFEEQIPRSLMFFYHHPIKKILLQLKWPKEIVALLIVLKITIISSHAQMDSTQFVEFKKLISNMTNKIDTIEIKLNDLSQSLKLEHEKKEKEIVGLICLRKSCLVKMYDSKKVQIENAEIKDYKHKNKLSEKGRYKYTLIESVLINIRDNKISTITVIYDGYIVTHEINKPLSALNQEFYFDLITSNEKINLLELIEYSCIEPNAQIAEVLIKLSPTTGIQELTKKQ